jgi:hypothetical protein
MCVHAAAAGASRLCEGVLLALVAWVVKGGGGGEVCDSLLGCVVM